MCKPNEGKGGRIKERGSTRTGEGEIYVWRKLDIRGDSEGKIASQGKEERKEEGKGGERNKRKTKKRSEMGEKEGW